MKACQAADLSAKSLYVLFTFQINNNSITNLKKQAAKKRRDKRDNKNPLVPRVKLI